MTTLRVEKNRDYFAVSNEPFNDERLTWGARGLMGYLLSKPDNWQIRVHDLVSNGPAGKQLVQSLLAELDLFGYISRKRIARPDGTFDWITTIYESPSLNLQTGDITGGSGRESTIKHFNMDGPTVEGSAMDDLATDGSTIDGEVPCILSTELTSTELTSSESTRTESTSTEQASTDAASSPRREKPEPTECREPPANREAFEQSFGLLLPGGQALLLQLERTYSAEWVQDAIREAARGVPAGDTRFQLGCVRKILQRWKTGGPAESVTDPPRGEP
jgi:hypothetical protein